MPSNLPYIDHITVPKTITLGSPVTFIIHGNWPTPAWTVKSIEVVEHHQAQSIDIYVHGISAKGLSLQVLQPFSETVDVTFLRKGTWSLIFYSRGRVHNISVLVL